jgi:hypothetical protein
MIHGGVLDDAIGKLLVETVTPLTLEVALAVKNELESRGDEIRYRLESRYSRLRARGLLSLHDIARHLDVKPDTIKIWRRAGLLRAHPYDDKGQCLFEVPGPDAPIKYRHQRKSRGKSASCQATVNPLN